MIRRCGLLVTLEQCWHAVPGGTARCGTQLGAPSTSRATSSSWASPPVIRARPPRHGAADRVRHLCRPLVALRLWACAIAAGTRVERATGPVDVVHGHRGGVPPRGAPVVMTIHDLAFLDVRAW